MSDNGRKSWWERLKIIIKKYAIIFLPFLGIGNIGPLYEQVVRLGNSLFVKCETPKANPVILNVEWTLGNGDPLPSDGRFTVAGNELQIRNTNKNDSGIYQCIARNIAGEKRLNVTVIVASKY